MKVFISSTFRDLERHRAAAADVIERLGVQLSRMEKFGARPEEPCRACLDEIEESDLFIGIYAHRYGFIPEGSKVSITEAEFNHANALHRPTFCFLVEQEYPWDENLIDCHPDRALLEAFKARIASLVVRDVFTTPEVLATRVATAVGRYLIADPRRTGATNVSEFARTNIADGATAVFVDIMRLACVSASSIARSVNQPRYGEFVDIADLHLSDFRGQVSRLAGERDAEMGRRCAEVDTRLAWAVMRLRHTAMLGSPWTDFVQVLHKLAEQVEALASLASPTYYKARVEEIVSIVKRQLESVAGASLLNPDIFVQHRFAMQSEVIKVLRRTAAIAIATVRDDMDRTLAIPYFTIDYQLLGMAIGSNR